MLETQRFLHDQGMDALVQKLSLRTARHPVLPLVILNYDQIHSPKRHAVVRECRGLTLELDSWDVVARGFPRFFNYAEDQNAPFDWDDFVCENKEDGSLMLLYNYRGNWLLNTRGSFASGEIAPGAGKTWEEVFYEALLNETGIDGLDKRYTYVFELCSPYNRVVRRYAEPTLFLLSAFHNATGSELHECAVGFAATVLGVHRPGRIDITPSHDGCPDDCYADMVAWLDGHDDPTFEGFVLRDRHGRRLKVKSKRYVALHHLKNNGNVFLAKNLLPLVMKGEHAELLLHFPETAAKVFDVVERVGGAKQRMLAVWDHAKGIESQKDFAVFVNKHTTLSPLLFMARKQKERPETVFEKSEDILLKKLFKEAA